MTTYVQALIYMMYFSTVLAMPEVAEAYKVNFYILLSNLLHLMVLTTYSSIKIKKTLGEIRFSWWKRIMLKFISVKEAGVRLRAGSNWLGACLSSRIFRQYSYESRGSI